MEEALRWRTMSMEELRRRVRDAEGLLRVARELARDELRDPTKSDRARDRIAGIMKEIDALFPGMSDPVEPVDPAELIAPSMRGAASGGEGPELPLESELEDEEDEDEEDEEDGEDDDEEWEVDYAKLARAIESEELMAQIPEVDRAWFKRMAERQLEAHERVELCERVHQGFDELSQMMRQGVDELTKQLAVALTFEGLKAKKRLE